MHVCCRVIKGHVLVIAEYFILCGDICELSIGEWITMLSLLLHIFNIVLIQHLSHSNELLRDYREFD